MKVCSKHQKNVFPPSMHVLLKPMDCRKLIFENKTFLKTLNTGKKNESFNLVEIMKVI